MIIGEKLKFGHHEYTITGIKRRSGVGNGRYWPSRKVQAFLRLTGPRGGLKSAVAYLDGRIIIENMLIPPPGLTEIRADSGKIYYNAEGGSI